MKIKEAKVIYMNTQSKSGKNTVNGISMGSGFINDPVPTAGNQKPGKKTGESCLPGLFRNMMAGIMHTEMQLLPEIQKLQAAATTVKLKNAFNYQLQQTRGHISLLHSVYSIMNENIPEKNCLAIPGLPMEARDFGSSPNRS